MKSAWLKIFAVVFVAALCYGAFAGVFLIDDHGFGVIKDRGTGNCRYLYPGFNFVPEGLFPGRIRVARYPVKMSHAVDARVPLPPLQKLESDHYTVVFKLNVQYEILPRALAIKPDDLTENTGLLRKLVVEALQGHLAKGLLPYLQPNYNRDALIRAGDGVIKGLIEGDGIAGRLGIKFLAIEQAGAVYAPEYRTYLEGVALLDQMRAIENNNKKEMLVVSNMLKKNKLLKDEYMEKLGDISRLIKQNPDLLKYIYIDRLGENVKVIIAPEKSGIPFGLTDDGKSNKSEPGSEIDNLR